MNLTDTIAAIATPPGEGGIGIVRLSGPEAEAIACRLFRTGRDISHFESHRLYYGTIEDPADKRAIDSCLMVVMKGPHSFTGEDTVEFQCHGGQLLLKRVLEALLRQGARLAEAGEFTRRAFLNGKIDLAQAEAIVEVIKAKTDLALSVAHNQLKGRISREVNGIKGRLVTLLSRVEADLDFPEEEDVATASPSETAAELEEIEKRLMSLLLTYEEGKIIREGVRVVILGRPNVGKSTLLNLLLREERAIVTPIPGTTRDVIEEVVNIRGLPVRLMDTAGLREGADTVEAIGLRFAQERLKEAHLVLYVTDFSSCSEEDKAHLTTIRGKKVIVIINKTDLATNEEVERASAFFSRWRTVPLSALQERGVDVLEGAIFEEATGHSPRYRTAIDGGGDDLVITSVRHKAALEGACAAVKRGTEALSEGLSGEFLALELRGAIEKVGEITGEVTNDDILGEIFSHFCIGK